MSRESEVRGSMRSYDVLNKAPKVAAKKVRP